MLDDLVKLAAKRPARGLHALAKLAQSHRYFLELRVSDVVAFALVLAGQNRQPAREHRRMLLCLPVSCPLWNWLMSYRLLRANPRCAASGPLRCRAHQLSDVPALLIAVLLAPPGRLVTR